MFNSCRQSGISVTGIIIALIVVGFIAAYTIKGLFTGTGDVRDETRRKDLSNFEYILKEKCYFPPRGAGEYDLAEVFANIKASVPKYAYLLKEMPFDPAEGTAKRTAYTYIVSLDGRKCAIYANLENPDTPVTLTNISFPTPGAGTGVIEGKAKGKNGTNKYYQVSS